MRIILPALFLMAPVMAAAAQESPPSTPGNKLSAISLLPPGSQLKGVMLPRYDEKRSLSAVLIAQVMTLVSDTVISGDAVSIEFFNPDRSPRGRIDLVTALLDQSRGLLRALENVTIQGDRIHAQGVGLVYAIEQGEGFLMGPAVTRIQPATETAMKSPSATLHTAAASVAAASALVAAPPTQITSEQAAAIQADAAAVSQTHAQAAASSRTNLRAQLEASTAANSAATNFLDQAELLSDEPAPTPEPAQPLEVKPGPNDTVITCDGGMYFDVDAGLFVYLKNVRVADPRFSLSGANELKIFLAKKPEEPATDPKAAPKADKPSGIGLNAKFGDVERIVATGAVRILQKQPEAGKEPVEASGAIFTYQPEAGEIVLSGGFPWVRQGASFMRALEPNLILRIQKNGSFVTEGNWDMGGNLNPNP